MTTSPTDTPDGCQQVPLKGSRCPSCANETNNTRLEPAEGADRDDLPPPSEQGICGDCGRRARPGRMAKEYREHRLTDDERDQAHEREREWAIRSADEGPES